MRRSILLMLSLGGLTLFSGCQCTIWHEKYADLIDGVSERKWFADRFYHPCLDLNRIGKPEWCQCGINRLWCKRACCPTHGACGPCPFCSHPPPDDLGELPLEPEPMLWPDAPQAEPPADWQLVPDYEEGQQETHLEVLPPPSYNPEDFPKIRPQSLDVPQRNRVRDSRNFHSQ